MSTRPLRAGPREGSPTTYCLPGTSRTSLSPDPCPDQSSGRAEAMAARKASISAAASLRLSVRPRALRVQISPPLSTIICEPSLCAAIGVVNEGRGARFEGFMACPRTRSPFALGTVPMDTSLRIGHRAPSGPRRCRRPLRKSRHRASRPGRAWAWTGPWRSRPRCPRPRTMCRPSSDGSAAPARPGTLLHAGRTGMGRAEFREEHFWVTRAAGARDLGTWACRRMSHVGKGESMSTIVRPRGMLSRMTWGTRAKPGETGDQRAPAPGSETEEMPLVERARRGDRGAFDLLGERHLQHVWAVVWRILRHHEDTEDVVQEVFLAAFQALPRYRGESRLSTWLHRIAVTRALNHLDRKEEKMRRALRNLEDGNPLLEAAPEAAAGWFLRGSPSPLQVLEADDLMRRLAACLSRLPAAWRAILTLRDVDARSYEEIAALAGLALGTVRSRLARARVALRQCVAGEGP